MLRKIIVLIMLATFIYGCKTNQNRSSESEILTSQEDKQFVDLNQVRNNIGQLQQSGQIDPAVAKAFALLGELEARRFMREQSADDANWWGGNAREAWYNTALVGPVKSVVSAHAAVATVVGAGFAIAFADSVAAAGVWFCIGVAGYFVAYSPYVLPAVPVAMLVYEAKAYEAADELSNSLANETAMDRQVAVAFGKLNIDQKKQLLQVYREALKAAGLPESPKLIERNSYSFKYIVGVHTDIHGPLGQY